MFRSIFLGLLLATGLPGVATAQDCTPGIVLTAPDTAFVDNADGTVTDLRTGLVWKRCSEGQTYNAISGGCDGAAAGFTWRAALERAVAVNAGTAGENLALTDWRVPNIKELASLVERACRNPAINETLFPATPNTFYWSASPFAGNPDFAWVVSFGSGDDGVNDEAGFNQVRLVRGGQ